jgi:polyphosphate kinase
LRPRNLRRRVEIVVPIANAQHRRLLDDILRLYAADPTAWDLQADGSYVARPGGIAAQSRLGSLTTRKA